jgi:hypothetical protein
MIAAYKITLLGIFYKKTSIFTDKNYSNFMFKIIAVRHAN